VDEERARWTRFPYHADWNDPSLYDIVSHLGPMTLSGGEDVEVEADARMIAITGTVESMMEAGRVVMIVRKTQRVKDIHLTCASAILWSSRHNN
jgi:hypothetical protein